MNIRTFLLYIFFVFSSIITFSQTKSNLIADLESDLLLSDNKIEQIKLHRELADLYMDISLRKTFKHLQAIDKILKHTTIDDDMRAKFYETYGNAYFAKVDYAKALEYYKKELVIINNFGYKARADSITYNIAAIAYKTNDLKTAEEYNKKLLETARSKNDVELVKKLDLTLYKINSQRKDYREALLYLESYLNIIDFDFLKKGTQITILKKQVNYTSKKLKNTTKDLNITSTKLETTNKNLKQTNNTLQKTNIVLQNVKAQKLKLEVDTLHKTLAINKLELEKIQKEKEIKEKQAFSKLQEQKLLSKKKEISMLRSIIIYAIIIAFLILLLYRRIKRQNRVLKRQKALIEEKNSEITQSISYASRIQGSIMLSETTMQKYLPDLFIYFRPRDIVSGDFYWFSKVERNLLIATVDCTGHGVPGAFLSMIGNTLLNKIVNEYKIISPSMILSYLHEGMMAALEQNSPDKTTEDGMDMTLCTIIPDEKLVLYAGAKNPLLVFLEDQLVSVKADFQSIGEHPLRPGMDVVFTEHQIAYDDETIIYLMSDGFTDQFGREKGDTKATKFNVVRFKNMLLENKDKSMKELKEVITETMDEWKKDNEQTDDMLVIGIRLVNVNADD